jgi:hypothetical protein
MKRRKERAVRLCGELVTRRKLRRFVTIKIGHDPFFVVLRTIYLKPETDARLSKIARLLSMTKGELIQFIIVKELMR